LEAAGGLSERRKGEQSEGKGLDHNETGGKRQVKEVNQGIR